MVPPSPVPLGPPASDAADGELSAYEVSVEGSRQTIYVVCLAQPDADRPWMEQVASSVGPAPAVFLGEADARRTLTVFEGATTRRAGDDELRATAQVLLELSHDTPTVVTPDGERTLPSDPAAAITSVEMVRTRDALDKHLETVNTPPLDRVAAQLSSPMGVIPFVGAGMSMRFGFPGWGEFLRLAASGQAERTRIDALVAEEQYESAAEELERANPDGFQRKIEDVYRRPPDQRGLEGEALWALALLAHGPVVTTNFDHVLEHVFESAGNGFGDERIVGAQPDRIVRALHTNEHALLKIHGDADDRALRTFTAWEYDQTWPDSPDGQDSAEEFERQPTLSSLAWLIFTNRPLLFLGASLDGDRTVRALREIYQRLRGLGHYAIVEASWRDGALTDRRGHLEACGIQPIWFAPHNFDGIREHLWTLHERTLGRELRSAPAPAGGNGVSSPPTGDDVIRRFVAAGSFEARKPADSVLRDIQRIARALLDGRLAFFLGAGAHLGRFALGRDFVKGLAEQFGVAQDEFYVPDRLARRIIDRQGVNDVLRQVESELDVSAVEPSVVYEMLAALPGYLRSRGHEQAATQIVLTTNYDMMLEKSFAAAGEPFHLLTYIGHGDDVGRFSHLGPDGSVRVLERAALLNAFKHRAHVLVKLNGGVRWDPAIPESLVLARGDPERLSGRIPEALPAVLRTALRERALLFLGHGLDAIDTEAIIRYSNPTRAQQKSWAVKHAAHTFDEEDYWSVPGLKLVHEDLEAFMLALHHEVGRQVDLATGTNVTAS